MAVVGRIDIGAISEPLPEIPPEEWPVSVGVVVDVKNVVNELEFEVMPTAYSSD